MASSMMVLARAPLEEDTARGREGGVGDQLDRRAVHSYFEFGKELNDKDIALSQHAAGRDLSF